MWRNVLSNEKKGMPTRDNFGANAGVSLLWLPYAADASDYRSGSQRRVSELKQVQDFGSPQRAQRAHEPVAIPQRQPPPRPPPAAVAAAPSSSGLGFLGVESSRLQAANQARQLGQTFLMQGNLAQAKLYLQKAEKILGSGLDGPSGGGER